MPRERSVMTERGRALQLPRGGVGTGADDHGVGVAGPGLDDNGLAVGEPGRGRVEVDGRVAGRDGGVVAGR